MSVVGKVQKDTVFIVIWEAPGAFWVASLLAGGFRSDGDRQTVRPEDRSRLSIFNPTNEQYYLTG